MIAICPNPFRDKDLNLSRQAKAILDEEGFETAICPVFAEPGKNDVLPGDLEYSSFSEIEKNCTLALAIGGDGTLLTIVRSMTNYELPVLGINLGTKGFLAELEPESLPLIVKAAKGDNEYSIIMMLDVELERDGKTVFRDCALNDVVMHGYGDCIRINTWCDGDKVTSFSGDGIILATPTGSTGYSMSAGGPIVEPDAKNIIISPICAHMMSARSFVLDPERSVSVIAEKLHDRRAYLSVDGNFVLDIDNGDVIKVKKSQRYTRMVEFGINSFFEIAYKKLT
ncbi:MAG: NAD(+)/NADH kinase [Oscillospiraceae bacterium]|nr:NAD(+)/NADH kinase [Oscillospiraceae bacterium]